MNEEEKVRLPIETYTDGNKITKVCVEDVYKVFNRILEQLDKSYNKSIDIIDSVDKEVNGYEGSLIIGTGTSQPCLTDAFDEEIGNNIAFMKAKLNANLKKFRLLNRIYKEIDKILNVIENEQDSIYDYIQLDLEGLRKYNPDYLKDRILYL